MDILGLGFAALIVLVVASRLLRPRSRERELAAKGRRVPGTVLAKHRRPKPRVGVRHAVTYSYRTEDGQLRKGRGLVSRAEFDRLEEGSSVGVLYLPENPEVSALESSVERRLSDYQPNP